MKINSSSLYRDIFKRAFFITLHNRFLWVFGLFATFLGLGSIYEMVVNKSLQNSEIFMSMSYKLDTAAVSGFFISSNISNIKVINILLLAGAIILSFAVFAGLLYLAITSLGALIHSSKNLDAKKKTDFSKSFLKAKEKFWRLLGINIAGKIIIFIFIFVTGWLFSMILLNSSVVKALLFFIIYLVLVATSLVISFLIIYASCFTVLKSDSIKKSIINAWKLFTENWVVSAESAVIMFVLNLAVKILLFVGLIIFSLPFMLLLVMFYYSGAVFMTTLVIGLWIVFLILLMILAGSFFSAFQIVAWTLIFDRIAKGGILSKLHRIFG